MPARRRPARSKPAIKRAGKVIARGAVRERELPAAPREHRRRGRHARALVRGARRAHRGGGRRRRASASASTPATCSPRASTSAPPRRWRRSSTTATRVVGIDRLGSLHLNDSQTPLGSNRDRHADVGRGRARRRGLRGVPLRAALRRPAVRAGDARAGQARADAEQVQLAKDLRRARAGEATAGGGAGGLSGGPRAEAASENRPAGPGRRGDPRRAQPGWRGFRDRAGYRRDYTPAPVQSATPRPRSSGRARGREAEPSAFAGFRARRDENSA